MAEAGGADAAKVDFFISYTAADQDVAVWIAWVLEAASYKTVIQAWDFRPGREFVTEMQQALVGAQRVLAVLSPAYLASGFTRAEWNAAVASDPTGTAGRLLPVRVAEVNLQGLDLPRIYLDLVGVPKEEAKARLLAGVQAERAKPVIEPGYPERLGQPSLAAAHEGGLRLQRVSTCDPYRLGVHPSITAPAPGRPETPGQLLSELPRYVPRDIDNEVRHAIDESATRGGLVVLLGGSSTGKTRTAYEAIKAELSDWRLLHPADVTDITAAVATRKLPHAEVVIWLDELQHYLTGPNGLTVGTIRALLDPDQPTVLIATMWPQWYDRFTAMPPPHPDAEDPNRHARQILTTTAQVLRLADFSQRERDRMAALAGEDLRLEIALQDQNFGPTQVLAGAPQVVDRWEHSTDLYARALMTAAIDCRRLGLRAPLSIDLLRDAVPSYLTRRQIATAPYEWFTHAMAYASQELHGATSALVPVPGQTMGSLAGYTVADFLLQHGHTTRRADLPSGSLWDSAVAHITHVDDRVQLAHEAQERSLYRHAVLLATPAAEAGNQLAVWDIVKLLKRTGRNPEAENWLRHTAETGSPFSMLLLAELLEQTGRGEEAKDWSCRAAGAVEDVNQMLRTLGKVTRRQLGKIKPNQEAEDWLRQAAEAADPAAMWALAGLLEWDWRDQEAKEWLGRAAKAGDRRAMRELAGLLDWDGRDLEAENWLRRAGEAGDPEAIREFVERLNKAGYVQEAKDWLRRVAEAGHEHDAEDWLRRAAEAGDPRAMKDFAQQLVNAGRRPEAEDWLRRAVEAGNSSATRTLATLLTDAGRGQEADRLRRFGIEPGGRTADAWMMLPAR
jgi:TPR repeat protein